ncbi:MAG TPA: hypothetical protein VMY79_03135 [Dehalococcoidia bacterium]|nr:hypothetical protein [Dehalococcoidia bacterium]
MADTEKDIYQLVKGKREEMKPIFDRMDTDEKLYFLEPYRMKKLPPKQGADMEGVANITLPDPQLVATKAIALLGGLDMQKIVEGRDITDKQTTKIEEFLDDIFYVVDEHLVKKGSLGLDGFTDEQDCMRGRIVARSCMRLDKEGNLIPDVLPIDARCFVSENDGSDMVWGAAWFMQSQAQLEREFNKPGDKEVKVGSGKAEVVDFWDLEKNVAFVDGRKTREQPNPYDHVNFVQSIVPFGSMFSTEDALKHQGESIFWASRDLWPEKNMIATILATLTIEALRGGMQLESKDGREAKKPEESPYGTEKVQPVDMGGGYKAMPINDIKNATRLLYSIIETDLQRSGFTALDYGSLTFPLSAIAVTKLTIARNDFMLPRIQAKAIFRQALSRMIINQCIMWNQTLKLGQPGKQNPYSPGDLTGDYQINYRFLNISKEQTIADVSIANAAQGYLSGDTIRRDVLKLQDPDGEKVKFDSEQAERVDEVLFLYRRASSLLEGKKVTLKNQVEAYILAQRIVTILVQRKAMGALSPIEKKEEAQPEPEGKDLLPLFAGGGGGGGQKTTGAEETESE